MFENEKPYEVEDLIYYQNNSRDLVAIMGGRMSVRFDAMLPDTVMVHGDGSVTVRFVPEDN